MTFAMRTAPEGLPQLRSLARGEMLRVMLLAAAATVAAALTPAQANLLLSLQGKLQELK